MKIPSKSKALACNFTKSNTPPCVFFTIFKLCKLYQIAQRITYTFLFQELCEKGQEMINSKSEYVEKTVIELCELLMNVGDDEKIKQNGANCNIVFFFNVAKTLGSKWSLLC